MNLKTLNKKNSPWLEALALPAATDCFYQVSHSKLLISTALFQPSYFCRLYYKHSAKGLGSAPEHCLEV